MSSLLMAWATTVESPTKSAPPKPPTRASTSESQRFVDAPIAARAAPVTIKPKSKPVLDTAVKVLKDFPDVKVEIAGHTDSTGDRTHNIDLSQRRADAVKKYLVDHGIAEDRISAFHLVELGSEGDEVEMTALEDALILFGHAEPIGAPVVSHGPFVMNSRAEIEQAIRDYQAGKFGAPM